MKVTGQVGLRKDDEPRQLVSPLEQTLDAAVESERHRWVRAARDRAELLRVTAPPARAALAHGQGTSSPSEPSRAPASAGQPAPHGARTGAELVGRGRAGVNGWVQLCAVALGVLAVLTAFQLPVPAPSPAPAPVLGAVSSGEAPAPARPDDVRAPRAAVTTGELPPDRAAPERAEPVSQTSMLRPSQSRAEAAARPTLDSGALPPALGAASPTRPDPPRASAEPTAQRAKAQVVPAARAAIVTVDDMFGIGGDEPLPPEALDGPTPAASPAPRSQEPARAAPEGPPSLFYQEPPF